jgi:hypothetical protein
MGSSDDSKAETDAILFGSGLSKGARGSDSEESDWQESTILFFNIIIIKLMSYSKMSAT